ncbi:hypothetical protein MC885_011354, partial [Smutsia gigantea]
RRQGATPTTPWKHLRSGEGPLPRVGVSPCPRLLAPLQEGQEGGPHQRAAAEGRPGQSREELLEPSREPGSSPGRQRGGGGRVLQAKRPKEDRGFQTNWPAQSANQPTRDAASPPPLRPAAAPGTHRSADVLPDQQVDPAPAHGHVRGVVADLLQGHGCYGDDQWDPPAEE